MEVSGAMLRDGIINAANLISSRRMELNRINVFPVPDSDTGSNMAVTLGAAKGGGSDCGSCHVKRLPREFRGNLIPHFPRPCKGTGGQGNGFSR